MIISLEQTTNQPNISYRLKDSKTGEEIANASDNFKEWATLEINNNKYEIIRNPKIVQKVNSFPNFPQTLKWKKTVGFIITKNSETFGYYYPDAATITKKLGFIKFNITFNTYCLGNDIYTCHRVGLKGTGCSYFCILKQGVTVAIIKKPDKVINYKDTFTAYIKDKNIYEQICLIMIVIDTTEFVNIDDGGLSVGGERYISVAQAEKDLFDSNFIDEVDKID